MDPDRFRKIEAIYHAALKVEAERLPNFLKDECGSDTELKTEVEAMLQLEKSPNSFLDNSPADLAAKMFSEQDNANDLLNKTIGRYNIRNILGEGGMGTVYLAYDSRLARSVALKVLPAEMVSNNDRVQRFMHEARAASALNHPHILTVYEIDEFTDVTGSTMHFISMEFVDGKTLEQLIYKDKIPREKLLKYLSQAASGLAKAHSAGIIHRDLKPENIMVSNDGFAKILDFGLAKLTDIARELSDLQQHRSRPGVILGTLGYMSPEQALGKTNIDERSDIFAFGCILYEVMAGRKAFQAETTIDALHQIIHSEPMPLKAIDPSVPDLLSNIIEKCLAKDPEDRYRDAGEIAALIRTVAVEITYDGTHPLPRSEQPTIFEHGVTTGSSASQTRSGQRRQVTVMLIDASAIADLFEDLDPERSSVIMNDMWEFLWEIVILGGGRIGERFGDTVLAVWGSEVIQESDPERSVRTALDLQAKTVEYFDKHLRIEISPESAEAQDADSARFLKISISTGTVLVGNSRATGEFITTGPAVNVAKRTISTTPIGDVIVSHDTYRHIRGLFRIEEIKRPDTISLGPQGSRSRQYLVKGVKPRVFRTETRGVEGVETPMIGRKPELTKLMTFLDAVKEDRELQIVTVVGPAGIGKSRLLYEFSDKVDLLPDRYFVFKARALETMQGQPFSLVKDIFLFRFDIGEKESEATAREKFVTALLNLTADETGPFGNGPDREMKAHFVGQLIGFDFSDSPHIARMVENEGQIQDRAILYASQFFISVSKKHPVIFYLDDLHWADDESLNFLDIISQNCGSSPIFICCFARNILFERRPHWGEGRENWGRIELPSLTKHETAELIAEILEKADNVPEPLQDLLITKTAGNPFYIEEMIKMFIDQGVIETSGEQWAIAAERLSEINIPQTLTGVLQSRLDRLSDIERRVLQRASVVGREFWDSTLADLDDGIDLPSILGNLRKKELLFRKETSVFDNSAEYVFKHALLRDVTYETILLEERRNWHLRTAELLIEKKGKRRDEYPALIAEHYEKGGEIERSANWYGRAAESARRSHALEISEKYFIKALENWETISSEDQVTFLTPEQVMKWHHALGRVLYLQARFHEAIAAFARVLDMANALNSKLGKAYAYWGLSFTQFELGETRLAYESSIETERLGSDPELASSKDADFLVAAGLYRQGRALISMGRFEDAISLAERAQQELPKRGGGTTAGRINSLHILAAANMYLGRFKEAQEFERQEVKISREVGDLRTASNGLNSLGFQSYMQGKGKEAIEYYEEALQIAFDIGNKSGVIMIQSNIYGAKVLLEEYSSSEDGLRALIDEVGDKGHFLVSEMYRFLAEALVGQGKYDDALAKAKRSLTLSEETENPEAISEAWRVLGIVASCLKEDILLNDQTFSASDCFQRSLDDFEKLGMEANYALTLRNFAQHERKNGDLKKAADLLDREAEISKRLGIDTGAKCVYFRT